MNINKLKNIEVFVGPKYVKESLTNAISSPLVQIQGYAYRRIANQLLLDSPITINLDKEILSKHILILGGIGTGKTNLFKSIIKQSSKALRKTDAMLVFDTKGEFYRLFGDTKKDIVITNSSIKDKNGKAYNESKESIWNIFEELDEEKLYETSNEIASMLFAPHVEKTSNSFFPLAAKSIFASVLRAIYRIHKKDPEELKSKPSNALLKEFFNGKNIFSGVDESLRESDDAFSNIVSLLRDDVYERGSLGYISANTNADGNKDGQTLGVLAELRLVVDEIFVGSFAKEGDFSISKTFRKKSGKRVFLEYDIVEGNVLSPIYSLLVDLAIKESLAPKNEGADSDSYFIIDEFKLLPRLKHLDDAINFGRSLGVKLVIGLQNISQIIEHYGQEGSMNILSGFSTTFAFKVSDYATRSYLIELFGKNKKLITYLSAINSRGVIETLESANVVEDWDILNLKKGECIIRLPGDFEESSSPFFVKTSLFN